MHIEKCPPACKYLHRRRASELALELQKSLGLGLQRSSNGRCVAWSGPAHAVCEHQRSGIETSDWLVQLSFGRNNEGDAKCCQPKTDRR